MMKPVWSSPRFWLALIAFLGIIFLKYYPFPITIAILALAYFFNPATWRPLKNYRFWIVITLLIVVVPTFTGSLESKCLGIRYSSDQLAQMTQMSLRGIAMFLMFQILTTDLDSKRMRSFLQDLGLSHFDTLFILSQESLPTIRSILKARLNQFKKVGQTRISPKHFLKYASTVLEDMINLADKFSEEPGAQNPPDPYDILHKVESYEFAPLLIVVGDPGTGKSPWVRDLIQLLRTRQIIVAGLISNKVRISENIWFHELEDLSSGQKLPLNTMDELSDAKRVGKFSFLPGIFQWAKKRVLESPHSEWLILDEVGPLELAGKGFSPILQLLDSEYEGVVVLTIRSTLGDRVDNLLSVFPRLAARQRIFIEIPRASELARAAHFAPSSPLRMSTNLTPTKSN